jgi:Peptidase family M1 domain
MKKVLVLLLSLFCLHSFITGQNLYMPRNVKQAYKNGTRSMDGKPGKNYWQNFARYNITVTVNPPSKTVVGTEEIVYINNSPDTLKSLAFKLILNAHTAGAVRQNPVSSEYLTKGLHIDKYAENNVDQKWTDAQGATNQQVRLNRALLPHDSVKLSIDWHYDLATESNREGATDSTTFYLAYFYPRVSVRDDYNGWDMMTFTEAQEFYNDFNDYTVQVKVPKNFIVWSTGDLMNPDEVLQPTYAQRLKASMTNDSTMHIATLAELKAQNVTAQKDNVWIWKANNISDIAINISDHYLWDAASVVVDDATKRRASVQAAYNVEAKDFQLMVQFGRHSLDWFSHNYPGVPYPYSKTTIVRGFADMEYPMMVNDNTTENPIFSRFVAEHEIAHTWFPFYMGINETRYGFMDEGWATALEYLIGINDLGKDRAGQLFKMFRVNSWIKDPSQEQDIPIITPTNILSGSAMGNNEYGKAALGYLAVKDLLGDVLFKKALHNFMDNWNGKHPTPWDMFFSFNTGAGKDLNWFWQNWFFTNNYIDLAISSVKTGSKETKVTLQNIGGYPAPVDVIVTYTDKTKEVFHQTPEIWLSYKTPVEIKLPTKKKVESIVLDGGIFMDADETNNVWKAN